MPVTFGVIVHFLDEGLYDYFMEVWIKPTKERLQALSRALKASCCDRGGARIQIAATPRIDGARAEDAGTGETKSNAPTLDL